MGAQFIVINGKKYDAKTGRLIENTTPVTPLTKPAPGVALDGFSRRPKTAKPVVAHAIHQKTEKSKTLMRGAVKKPITNKVHAKAHHVSHAPQQTQGTAKPVAYERFNRAAAVPKSHAISRFGISHKQEITPARMQHSIAQIPVKPAPAVTMPVPKQAVSRKEISNPFAAAVENATSHEQIKPKKQTKRHKIARALKVSPRMVSVGSAVFAIVLLGGFFVYQNVPVMAMRVAAARSGVDAQIPSYKPGGFALSGPITYSTGKISVNYQSASDNRSFRITQSNSAWNSETLLENYVAVNRRAYQTFQDRGKTIFIYDGSNATWVDRGVWYQIEGASALNSDQLLRIANSL